VIPHFTAEKRGADGCLEGEQTGIIEQAVENGRRNGWRGGVIDFCLQNQMQLSVELYYLANDDKKKVLVTLKDTYEGDSVNRSQMDMKRETCDIRTWEHLFLDISSTSTDTLVPSLYQCVETRSRDVFLTVVSVTSAPGRESSATFERLRENFSSQL
jgi:hypothetical protein